MKVKIAGKKSILFYWSGLLTNNPMFFPVSISVKQNIKANIKRLGTNSISIPHEGIYSDFIKIKRNMLIINFKINKTVFKYQFLHHLSGWHYSTCRPFQHAWLKSPTKLSISEQQAIRKWKVYSEKLYDAQGIFLLEKYFKKTLTKTERELINEVFLVLDTRFNQILKKQQQNMLKVKKCLEQNWRQLFPHIQNTFNFYGSKFKQPRYYLTPSYNSNKHAGGMYLAGNVIMEFGDFKLKDDYSPLLYVLAHEVTHQASEKIKSLLPERLNIHMPKNFTGTVYEYVEEAIHGALWSPEGIYWTQLRKKNPKLKLKIFPRKAASPYRELNIHSKKIARFLLSTKPTKLTQKIAHKIILILKDH